MVGLRLLEEVVHSVGPCRTQADAMLGSWLLGTLPEQETQPEQEMLT